MQEQPKKTVGNYNELVGDISPATLLPQGVIGYETGEKTDEGWQEVIRRGLNLVYNKVDQILGSNNSLTEASFSQPKVIVLDTDPENPNYSGYFSSAENKIVLIEDKINRGTLDRIKVFIHEYLHFLSHNGRDDEEVIHSNSPLAQNNNVGFRRTFGFDIRPNSVNVTTGHYFLAFNEAVTEQLAIDILPGVHETYEDYRGLLEQVIIDAIELDLGSKNEDGLFITWSEQDYKNYIYKCFFKGDLSGFSNLLNTIYSKYGLSEQQFGLMTHRDDLPSIIERQIASAKPGDPPTAPSAIALRVQERLNNKTPYDYVTDIIDPDPGDGGDPAENLYGSEYDNFITENNITVSSRAYFEGIEHDFDSAGFVVYKGEEASSLFDNITKVLDDLLAKVKTREISTTYVSEQIDDLLFGTHHISMLSEGFRDFYIYKHLKLENL